MQLLGNFPWMVPIFRFLLKGGNMQKKFYIIHDAAMKLIKERREENKPGKVLAYFVPVME